jgi:broad specificity phosphatase PhoE
MADFYLIRHAAHDLLGSELVGRRPDVRLNNLGAQQASLLARRLAAVRFAAVLSSPRERACETAAPLAAEQEREVELAAALDEVDFGEWTGRSFAELETDPRWQEFNCARSRVIIPGGEAMLGVQLRMVGLLQRLAEVRRESALALVSHGDVIRGALLHYLGMPLDHIHRLEIAPASVSILRLGIGGPRVLALNRTVDGPC